MKCDVTNGLDVVYFGAINFNVDTVLLLLFFCHDMSLFIFITVVIQLFEASISICQHPFANLVIENR